LLNASVVPQPNRPGKGNHVAVWFAPAGA